MCTYNLMTNMMAQRSLQLTQEIGENKPTKSPKGFHSIKSNSILAPKADEEFVHKVPGICHV